MFFGTTNQQELFVDETGNRRFLPVTVGRANVEAIAADRAQLWAEGSELFNKHGVMWRSAETLAADEHEQHMVTDAWADLISEGLHRTDDLRGEESPASRGYVTLLDVLRNILSLDAKSSSGAAGDRAKKCLRRLGWQPVQKRIDGETMRVWVPRP